MEIIKSARCYNGRAGLKLKTFQLSNPLLEASKKKKKTWLKSEQWEEYKN